jgi:hypothetical protein
MTAAGVSVNDIDFAEMYDCFTTEVVFYVEDYGFCKKGDGGVHGERRDRARWQPSGEHSWWPSVWHVPF